MKNGIDLSKNSPVQQGGIDRLCGLYSIINAIAYVDPYAYRMRQQLFDTGVRYLMKRNKLGPVMLGGMKPKLWIKLTKYLLRQYEQATSLRIETLKLIETGKKAEGEVWAHISRHVQRGSPVLIELEGRHAHFSVIVGLTESRVILFDSDGLCWLHRYKCGFSIKTDASTHYLIVKRSSSLTITKSGSNN